MTEEKANNYAISPQDARDLAGAVNLPHEHALSFLINQISLDGSVSDFRRSSVC